MAQLYTDYYLQQLKLLHNQQKDWGSGIDMRSMYAAMHFIVSQGIFYTTIIDYGCGKGNLQKMLKEEVTIISYDPAVEEYSKVPEPEDYLFCIDVLEHIEPEFLDNVLAHIASLTKRKVLLFIALTPAYHKLPDGRNAHICLLSTSEWISKLEKYFNIRSLTAGKFTMTYVGDVK